ncbi:hypothetical protein HYPSUDRAFT_32681 [Hypholoma sublateritium FD-334 SS-4]|uniref:Uncharacterized protein n=1 Tax=Hypholoma sublateritium (strain FD-334 SS-4) TaxID=945553 RepID=A0A0D2PET6_HYPSF|nr:hypothetical protein HYPSUDRAFT_32681 [Hypholoma sublateritium FD-334 SS-4]
MQQGNYLIKQYHSPLSLEQDYVRPALKVCYAYSKDRPISTVFLAFFGSLSALPVLVFLGLSLSIAAVFTATALGIALVAATAIILGLLAILCSVLVGTFFAALFLSTATVCTYFFVRFAMIVRQEGTSGVASWTTEMKQLAFGTKKQGQQHGRQVNEKPAHSPDQQNGDTKSPSIQTTSSESDSHIHSELAAGQFFNEYGVKEQGE